MSDFDIQHTLKEADTLARLGQFEAATAALHKVLDTSPDHVQALTMLSRVLRANGQNDQALTSIKRLANATPSDAWVWYDLGALFEQENDNQQAAQAFLKAWHLDMGNARFALNAGYAFWQTSNHKEALDIWSIGSDMDPMVRAAQFRSEADPLTRKKSNVADTELRRHFTHLYTNGLKKYDNPERLTSAMWPQTHFGNVEYKYADQKPYMFYAPDLPSAPVFDRSDIAWAKQLESVTSDIRAELNAYLSQTHDYGSPYLAHGSDGDESWRELQGSEDWNALHLFKDAKVQSCAESFPKTLAALREVPMVEMNGVPMEVFFSVLKPNTHIPPHFGLSNSRCTAHLPLIIPAHCEIRVSDHVHHWREGELFLFDDSFDHEARNDSDDIRIVLIFETWRPDLSSIEIEALQDSMETRAAWLNNRHIPESYLD